MTFRNYYNCGQCGETWEEISEPGTIDRCPCCDKETVAFRCSKIGDEIEEFKSQYPLTQEEAFSKEKPITQSDIYITGIRLNNKEDYVNKMYLSEILDTEKNFPLKKPISRPTFKIDYDELGCETRASFERNKALVLFHLKTTQTLFFNKNEKDEQTESK